MLTFRIAWGRAAQSTVSPKTDFWLVLSSSWMVRGCYGTLLAHEKRELNRDCCSLFQARCQGDIIQMSSVNHPINRHIKYIKDSPSLGALLLVSRPMTRPLPSPHARPSMLTVRHALFSCPSILTMDSGFLSHFPSRWLLHPPHPLGSIRSPIASHGNLSYAAAAAVYLKKVLD